jgi:hypothetical protein
MTANCGGDPTRVMEREMRQRFFLHDIEVALKLRLDPLELLLGSIALGGGESSLCSGYLHALGFRACGMKFDEHEPL